MKYLAVLLFAAINLLGDSIEGFYNTSQTEGKGYAIVAVYEYNNLYFGRIVATFDSQGKSKDTIYAPKERAQGVTGNPFYCGLDIIWNLRNLGIKFKGKILDPLHGHVYNTDVWSEGNDLVVRGKFMVFGQNQTWRRALDSDFPKDFKLPDLRSFVPSIPMN